MLYKLWLICYISTTLSYQIRNLSKIRNQVTPFMFICCRKLNCNFPLKILGYLDLVRVIFNRVRRCVSVVSYFYVAIVFIFYIFNCLSLKTFKYHLGYVKTQVKFIQIFQQKSKTVTSNLIWLVF